MRNYSFRKLTPQHMPLIRHWLGQAHVKSTWPQAEKQAQLMEQDMDNPLIDMRLVCLIDHPFAYIHDHDARAFAMPHFADLPTGTRVIDSFVGETEFQGQGHAIGFLQARLHDLRQSYPMAAIAVASTDTLGMNRYAQAGFKRRRLAPTRNGQLVQVMTHN